MRYTPYFGWIISLNCIILLRDDLEKKLHDTTQHIFMWVSSYNVVHLKLYINVCFTKHYLFSHVISQVHFNFDCRESLMTNHLL